MLFWKSVILTLNNFLSSPDVFFMLKAQYQKYRLHFKTPSGTSRGILTGKETYFLWVRDEENPSCAGLGECALFRGLSAEDVPAYEEKLQEVCRTINKETPAALQEWSSIRFGVEMALEDLKQGGRRMYFPSAFTEGKQSIGINGLIWMGDRETMKQRIREKLDAGFRCIKLKIGAIDFESELSLLNMIRREFSPKEVELRVDANGAFTPAEAPARLEQLSRYALHSIEQPIRQGQWKAMAHLCAASPVPIALDEELIGIWDRKEKIALLQEIRPAYLILKPALVGGFSGTAEWIRLAQQARTGWWITSALESNIGLNALAQWTFTLNNPLPQGLGTGQLYTNNISSPLQQQGSGLYFNPDGKWDFSLLQRG